MKAHNFKGGSISSHGYKLIYVGKQHHLADVRGYAYEHRLVAEKKIGRRLFPSEQVHHVDENKLNNSPENLLVTSIQEHHVFHRKTSKRLQLPGEENHFVECKCGCGQTFKMFDESGRHRVYVSGHNPRNSSITKDYILSSLTTGQKSIRDLIENYPGGKSVKTVVSKLKKQGKIKSVGHGLYEITLTNSSTDWLPETKPNSL